MKMHEVDIYWGKDKVRVVKREFIGDQPSKAILDAVHDRDLPCSTGACYVGYWDHARLEHLLYEFVRIVGQGVDVHVAHEEFMKIDEYRKWWRSAGGMMSVPGYRLMQQIGV